MGLSIESEAYITGAFYAMAEVAGGSLIRTYSHHSVIDDRRFVVCRFSAGPNKSDALMEFELPQDGTEMNSFFSECFARIKLELSE